jgi:hypothetical protein
MLEIMIMARLGKDSQRIQMTTDIEMSWGFAFLGMGGRMADCGLGGA